MNWRIGHGGKAAAGSIGDGDEPPKGQLAHDGQI
jgi:hypothetical protein